MRGAQSYSVRSVFTFNPRKLTSASFLNITANKHLRLDLPNLPAATPAVVFRAAHPSYVLPRARLTGFLYHHLPYPASFLSASLRFRCTTDDSPGAFAAGYDLPNRAGLPWDIDLPHLLASHRYVRWLPQLVRDGLLTPQQLSTARALLNTNDVRKNRLLHPAWVHDIDQPFVADLSVGMRVVVAGPRAHPPDAART
ncbi:hypothetical protein C8R46DRAFT_183432 [Mycena filopes]|nr:hypothetical protein C8R46DRAFT_183432 [Mycena filopes]